MDDGVEVRAPSASVSIGGEAVGVDAVSATFAVNQFPRASVTFHPADSNVRQMGATDVAQRVGAQQQNMFSAQTPSTSVSVNDGVNSFSFSGYIAAPSDSVGVGDIGLQTSILHEAASVSSLNTSVYANSLAVHRATASKLSSNIPGSLKGVLEEMISKWKNFAPDTESRAINEQINANNQAVIGQWYTILDQSEVEWPELDALLKPGAGLTAGFMFASIAETYKNAYQNFAQTMRQFQSQFPMLYVPSIEAGNPGKFIDVMAAVTGGENLTVPVRHIRVSGGADNFLPLSYVAVRGPKSDERRGDAGGQIIARWPPEAQSRGRVVPIGPPAWLPTSVIASKDSTTAVGAALDISSYRESIVSRRAKLRTTINPASQKLLERYARLYYVDMALAPSQCSFTIPLDVSITPGQRYTVSSPQGELFSGFLAQVDHLLQVGTGNGGAAHTTLNFTYVEAAGFELPYK